MLVKLWFILTMLTLSGMDAPVVRAAAEPQLTLLDGREKAASVLAEAMKNPKLQAVLTQHVHPKARILTLEMLSPESQEGFLNAGADGSPGLLRADFNGDGRADYAALLNFPQKKRVGEWLVVLLGTPGGGFQLRLLEKYDSFHNDVYLTMQLVEPSNSRRKGKSAGPGISRIHPDRSPTLFYWEQGRFQRLRIAESGAVTSILPASP